MPFSLNTGIVDGVVGVFSTIIFGRILLYLYQRHGFISALAGHVACDIVLLVVGLISYYQAEFDEVMFWVIHKLESSALG